MRENAKKIYLGSKHWFFFPTLFQVKRNALPIFFIKHMRHAKLAVIFLHFSPGIPKKNHILYFTPCLELLRSNATSVV